MGPLYGRQSRNGYDMAPDTELSVQRLHRFFTAWDYAPKAMIWDGRFVSIQPIAASPVVDLVIAAVPGRAYHLPL